MTTPSGILAWDIPQTEEPGGLQAPESNPTEAQHRHHNDCLESRRLFTSPLEKLDESKPRVLLDTIANASPPLDSVAPALNPVDKPGNSHSVFRSHSRPQESVIPLLQMRKPRLDEREGKVGVEQQAPVHPVSNLEMQQSPRKLAP